MKIAVYTICKNEKQFIHKWLKSCEDADYRLIVDTGSTDGTLDLFENSVSAGIHSRTVTINPWRFDDARNFALNLLPDDIDLCIALDMDEVLLPGWREKVEAVWADDVDRIRYNYIWSWTPDGLPGVTYFGDKMHKRHGFRWIHPVHEVAVKDGRLSPEKQVFIQETLIEHHADNTKPRSQYLPLLELSCREMPHDDRNAHYYARELYYYQHYEKAIKEFERHLALPTALWKAERAASYRYMGDCYWALGDQARAIVSFKAACMEAPGEREPLTALAQAYRAQGWLNDVIDTCEKILAIKEKPNSYINMESSWNGWPEQMLHEAQDELARQDKANTA